MNSIQMESFFKKFRTKLSKDNSPKMEIIICTEKGYLENTSKLLIASLRTFGGALKDTPVVSYQPRKGYEVSADTKKFFRENNVEHIELELNPNFAHYPLANKPVVCAHREQHSDADILVFLDSDVIIYGEPNEFLMNRSASTVRLRPVDGRNVGAYNSEDSNALYWNTIYKQLRVSNRRYVSSTVFNERILEYYNSGHIVVNRETGVYSEWLKNFKKVMNSGVRPDLGIFFVEQSVLAATITQMNLDVDLFGKEYNYPIHFNERLQNEDYFVSDFESLISIHYHKLFLNGQGANHSLVDKLSGKKAVKLNQLIQEFELFQTA